MKTVFFSTVIVLVLVSCKSAFFYTGLYTRADRRSVFYLKNYSQQALFCIPKFRSCHYTELRGNALAMSFGKIFFRRDSIDRMILTSYNRFFDVSGHLPLESTFFDRKCDTPHKLFSENLNNFHSDSGEACENVILPTLIITSNSGKHIQGGGGMEPAEDMGNDKHIIEYKLITSIYQNDTLIYMDNRTHWTEVFSERGEQLMYQVSQVVIDSLVTLTLQEYFKRMN